MGFELQRLLTFPELNGMGMESVIVMVGVLFSECGF